MEDQLFEQFRCFLPRFLNPDRQQELFKELKQFPNVSPFYLLKGFDQQLLQGDAWRGFVAVNFFTGERKSISGVILSNSCDVAIENERRRTPNILFAPLIPLAAFARILQRAGCSDDSVSNTLNQVRRQEVTSTFFFPAIPDVLGESMILLDDMHSHPLDHFHANPHTKVFTLSQVAFYLFLFKLSIHFTRLTENVPRYN